jgi:hypothetical protein
LLRKSRRNNLIKIFSALIADIDKILKSKVLIDSREKLSAKYYDYLDVFSRTLAERFFSFYFNINYKIVLEKTLNGKDPEVL